MKYIEVSARDHYQIGYRLGKLTSKLQRSFLKDFPLPQSWDKLIKKSKPFLRITKKVFPQYIEEVRGLAHGASVSFDQLWVLHCLDELEHKSFIEKCSSVFVKRRDGNYIVGHNEDWSVWTKPYYFILKRSIDKITVLELGMPGSISGGTVSINSYGIIQTINTLYHTDFQIGIPRLIVARWLSDRKSLADIRENFPRLKRAAGYCFNICDGKKLLSIEGSSKQYSFFETENNYAHTNHYISRLREIEEKDDEVPSPSRLRYDCILNKLDATQSESDMKDLLLTKRNDEGSIYRSSEIATVASIIFESYAGKCHVTQENLGKETRWESIPLDFLL